MRNECGEALSPSYQSTHSSFLPPSFGRRCPEGAEVGSRSGILTCGDANPASLRSSAPSRGRGANDFLGNTDSIVVIRGQGLALPHICRALFRFPHLSFMPPVPYPPLRGAFPSRGRLTIRESPLLKKVAHHPCEPIRSPSTVIPSAAEGSLLHCRHMHTCPLTQTTPWCFLFRLSLTHVLSVCRKYPSTSVGMTVGRRVVSHSFSHRFVDPSCAFGAPLL